MHKAKLHTGEEVAVKIQYPGLQRAADADLAVLRLLAAAAAAAFAGLELRWLQEELHRKLMEELDFTVRRVWGLGFRRRQSRCRACRPGAAHRLQ